MTVTVYVILKVFIKKDHYHYINTLIIIKKKQMFVIRIVSFYLFTFDKYIFYLYT